MKSSVNPQSKSLNLTPYIDDPENILRRCRINVESLKYLLATKQLDTKRKEELRMSFEICYQTIRRHVAFKDGSFRCLNENTEQSLWMSAYVVTTLSHLKKLINIDDIYIEKGLDFIAKMQQEDGSFPDKTAKYWFFRNRSNYDISLNAYLLIAIMESEYRGKYESTIEKSINFILNEDVNDEDNYGLSIVAYAMSLKNSSLAEPFQKRLMRNSVEYYNTYLMWFQEYKIESDINPISYQLEICSYAMISFINTNNKSNAFKILNWILLHNFNKVYIHTMDTIVTIDAITRVSNVIFDAPKTNMKFQFVNDDSELAASSLMSNNSKFELNLFNLTKNNLQMTLDGIGNAFVVVITKYTLRYAGDDDRFNLTFDHILNKSYFCVSIKSKESKLNQVAIQINHQAGFKNFDKFVAAGGRIFKESDQRILIFFDKIDSNGKCVKIPFQKPPQGDLHEKTNFASIFVYEVKKPENFAVISFSPWINNNEENTCSE